MKIKLIQRLIQVAAIVFLVWLVMRGVQRSDFNLLIMGGIVTTIFFADWLIAKKFPQTVSRNRVFKKLVWGFISLAILFTALSFINFDVSTSKAFSLTLNFTFVMLCLTYMKQQRLASQLVEEQKNAATI